MATSRGEPVHGLTPKKMALLPVVAELQMATALQLSRMTGMAYKPMRDHLCDLYRHGLLERTSDPIMGVNPPYIYRLSKSGAKHLEAPLFAFPSSLMMRHEIALRDFRAWLEAVRRFHGHEPLRFWKTGSAAYIGNVQPDGAFHYPFKDNVRMVGLVEIDMGTQTNPVIWKGKFSRYSGMMKSGDFLKVMGETRGRVIVVTPDRERSDFILSILSRMLQDAGIDKERFWVTERSTLEVADLSAALWRVPEGGGLMPLVKERYL